MRILSLSYKQTVNKNISSVWRYHHIAFENIIIKKKRQMKSIFLDQLFSIFLLHLIEGGQSTAFEKMVKTFFETTS